MRPVDIISAHGIAFPPAGSVVIAIIPGQWVLYVTPDHPAYADMLGGFLHEMSLDALHAFLDTPSLPDDVRRCVQLELAARGSREIN